MLAETELPSVSGAPAQGLRGEGFRSELVDPARLLLIQAEWRRLFEGACDPNPFLGPDFFLPLVAEVAGDRLTGVMVLRTDEAPRRSEFAALLPYRIASKFPLTSLPVVAAFAHPFVSDGTPLLRRDHVKTIGAAFIAALKDRFPGHILLIDHLRLESTTAAALRAGAAARGFPVRLVESHQRAALRAGASSETYLRERVSGKKLRELRRCEKRLREQGRVEMRTLVGDEAASGLQEFLRLEASGWKGRRGTALAATARTRAFAEAALAGPAAASVAVDVLRLDGVTIAAAVHLIAGPNAAAFKCAYDEAWSRMSPGVLLDLHTLRFALDEGRFALMDSCAVPGHPVEALWRDRVTIGRIAIGLGAPCDAHALDAFVRRQQTVSAWRADAKALMKRLDRLGTELRSGGYFRKS
jgi:CelD/BcsL family acetyltransferase involved in cellulose biosynthesis